MKNYKKHIDDFFREKLGRYRETPPDDVWDGLQGQLDTLKPYVPTSPFRWVWHFGMVSVIAVLSVSLTRKLINKPDTGKNQTEVVATTAPTTSVSEQNASAQVAEPAAAQQEVVAAGNEDAGVSATAEAQGAQSAGTTPAAATGSNLAGKDSKQHSIPGDIKTSVVREHNASKGTHSARSKDNAAQQLAYAANTGSRPASNRPGNTARNKKANSSHQKHQEFFSGNSSIAQLGSTMNTTADNSVAQSTELPPQAAAAANSSLAAVPVKAEKKIAAPEIKKPVIAPKIAEKKADKPAIKRFDFGVKAGYEQGFGNSSATKWVIAPYLQYHVAPKISLMLQPGIKYATIAQRNVGNSQKYYSINGDGVQVAQNGPTVIDSIKVVSTNVDTYYHTNYRYTQSHDSIVKAKTYGGSYVEFELPILVNYNVTKQLSVYGGVNLLFSKRTVVTENTYVQSGIQRTKDSTVYGTGTPTGLSAPAMSNAFTYTGNPYSDYQNTGIYPMKQETTLRVGYMLGLSYQYNNRWLFDALMQHSPLKPDVKDGYNLNSSLSSPYFRLSVGYKLTK